VAGDKLTWWKDDYLIWFHCWFWVHASVYFGDVKRHGLLLLYKEGKYCSWSTFYGDSLRSCKNFVFTLVPLIQFPFFQQSVCLWIKETRVKFNSFVSG